MKTKYIQLAALLSEIIIGETAKMHGMMGAALSGPISVEEDKEGETQAKKLDKLEAIQQDIQAMAGGFAAAPPKKSSDGFPSVSQMIRDIQKSLSSKPEPKLDLLSTEIDKIRKVNEKIMMDALRHGIGVMKVDLGEFFKDERAKSAPPSENKAQSAAFAAGQAANAAATEANAAYDAAVQAAVDLKFAGK